MQETDASAPVRRGEYEYFTRTVEGRAVRACTAAARAGTPGLPDPDAAPGTAPGEVVVLDENVLAEGHEYFALGGLAVSPDQRLLAYTVDTTGGERYELRFRDLDDRRRTCPTTVPDVYYGVAWANDDRTVFYTRPDDAMRPVAGLAPHARARRPTTTCSSSRRTTTASTSRVGRTRTGRVRRDHRRRRR